MGQVLEPVQPAGGEACAPLAHGVHIHAHLRVYLDRTVATLNSDGGTTDPDLLRFLSPLGWEHINLTGDYTWLRANHLNPGKYRPLRRSAKP
ncbi:hypothetical protein QFZ40_002233 [Arthrobacter pascens]|nr:hypothetical protein [Arthrobacter pascens]